MAIAIVMDWDEGTLDQYDEVIGKMGFEHGGTGAPDGIFHWAARTATAFASSMSGSRASVRRVRPGSDRPAHAAGRARGAADGFLRGPQHADRAVGSESLGSQHEHLPRRRFERPGDVAGVEAVATRSSAPGSQARRSARARARRRARGGRFGRARSASRPAPRLRRPLLDQLEQRQGAVALGAERGLE